MKGWKILPLKLSVFERCLVRCSRRTRPAAWECGPLGRRLSRVPTCTAWCTCFPTSTPRLCIASSPTATATSSERSTTRYSHASFESSIRVLRRPAASPWAVSPWAASPWPASPLAASPWAVSPWAWAASRSSKCLSTPIPNFHLRIILLTGFREGKIWSCEPL